MHYIIILALLIILSFLYLKLADKFNIIDKPNHRSSHTSPTIRGGGIIFYFGMLLFFITSGFKYPYFFTGVTAIALISFIDDIKTLSSSVRLPFQFLAVGLSFYQVGIVPEAGFWLVPFFILGVALINGFNFMDGINGITGLISIVTLLGIYAINLKEQVIDENLLLYVLMAVGIFGFFNFRKKARMFAGDIGSISVGVLICFAGSMLLYKTKSPVILMLINLYVVDANLTVFYRKSIGEKITEPHRKHIYQKMVHKLNFSHLQVSFIYALLQLLVNLIVYFTYEMSLSIQISVILIVNIVLASLYYIMFKRAARVK